MTEPKYLYGRMHFEDGYRPVLLKRGTKYFQALYIDSSGIFSRYVLFSEEKHFKEWANSNTKLGLKEIKRVARFLKNRSKVTGLLREMNKKNWNTLKEIIDYEYRQTT